MQLTNDYESKITSVRQTTFIDFGWFEVTWNEAAVQDEKKDQNNMNNITQKTL